MSIKTVVVCNQAMMFQYSLVYAVRSSEHPLSKHVASCALKLGTCAFTPHMTVQHSLSFEQAQFLHELFRNRYDVPRLTLLNTLKVTSTALRNGNGKWTSFHAIEQPVLINGFEVHKMHISLAYKVGAGFTLKELNDVHPWQGNDCNVLDPSELELLVWSCHSKSPKFWRKVFA